MAGTIQYLQSHTDTSDTNSYTFSSANLGTADSSRCIIVGIVSRKAGATTSISSVTVGGVSATIVKQQVNHATNTNVSGIAIAEVPTGTTGNIVVTFADSMLRCAVSVYRATGLSSTTPHDTDGSTASAPSVSLDVPTNGFAIGVGLSAASTTATWTGLTENIDETLESWVTYSSAHKEFASGATGETMTVTFGSSSEPAGSFASWQLLGDTADSERGLYIEGATASSSNWYNESWTKRVKVTIDHTKVGATLSNFPVYIDLSELPADFHTNCNQTDARDIRVTTSDEVTEVPREVVFYDSTTDTGELHFKAPSLSSSADTDFYIYYGNTSATEPASDSTYGSENVWGSYNVIVHFDEDPTNSNLLDSTANGNDGTPEATGLSRVAGKVGRATAHDSKIVDFGQTTDSQFGNGDFTVSLWAQKGESSSGWTNVAYIGKWNTGAQASTNEWLMGATVTGGDDKPSFSVVSGTTVDAVESATALTLDTWYYIVAKRSGGTLYLYVNGVEKATNTTLGTLSVNTVNDRELKTGSIEAGTSYNLEGIIDELRIIKGTAFSVDWIGAEYNNQSAPDTFATIGTAEEPPASGTSADSERGLCLGGKTSSGSERPLHISGSQILSTDYFNVEFGSASTNAGSERGLYIEGKDTSASERGLYLGGKLSDSSERGLYSSGELTDSSDRLLYSEGSIAESSDRLLYSKGNATSDSDRLVYTKGIATSSSDRLLNTTGKLTRESDRGLYTIGTIPEDYADSERLICTKGISTSSSDRGLYSVGGGVVNSERGLYTLAEVLGDSERGIYTTGKETGFSLRNLYTKGFNSSSSDRLLYTRGAAGGSSDRAIYSGGVLRSFSDRFIHTIGADTSSSGRRIYTYSVEPGLSERDLYTMGAGSGSSEIPIYTEGFETDSSERGVYSRGGMPSSSTRNLYIKGTWKPWVDKFIEYGTIYTDEEVTVGGNFVDLKMSGSDSFSNDSTTTKTWVDTKVSVTDNFIRKI